MARIEMTHIYKSFGRKVANVDSFFSLERGEIVSLLGENGSGKTTLMNMIAGIYFPDAGQIFIDGNEVSIRSPQDAYKYHIGMVHQHFKLVDVFSGIDNIIMGEKCPFSFTIKSKFDQIKEKHEKEKTFKGNLLYCLNILGLPFWRIGKFFQFNHLSKKRGDKIAEIVDKYGFEIDLNKKIYDMSVSEKQTVEIIKVLYRGADILILDEPTAVLTPQEIKRLFTVLREMKKHGCSIVIITHKLNEVLEISDRVTVLRKGNYIDTVKTSDTSVQQLTEMMVGKKISLDINRSEPKNLQERLQVNDLFVTNNEGRTVVKDVTFTAYSGEILGIAGISGSGQRELLEAIAGLQKNVQGEVYYFDPKQNDYREDLRSKNAYEIRKLGVKLAFVPEDRLGMGLVGTMDIVDNVMLRSYEEGRPILLDRRPPEKLADHIVEELEVSTPSTHYQISKLSGGNVQKVLIGREISTSPSVLLAAYPVRGLDINSSYRIYKLLDEQKTNGVAVIFVGEDLDVLLAVSDRILVLNDGHCSGIVNARNTTKEEIGLLMTKGEESYEKTISHK